MCTFALPLSIPAATDRGSERSTSGKSASTDCSPVGYVCIWIRQYNKMYMKSIFKAKSVCKGAEGREQDSILKDMVPIVGARTGSLLRHSRLFYKMVHYTILDNNFPRHSEQDQHRSAYSLAVPPSRSGMYTRQRNQWRTRVLTCSIQHHGVCPV